MARKSTHDCFTINLNDSSAYSNTREIFESSLTSIFRLISQFNRSLTQFFENMRFQFGFYTCCSRLYKALEELAVPISFPCFITQKEQYDVEHLVDVGLALKNSQRPISNSFSTSNKRLWIITGTNQGGKTTFLRSIGLAQIMAQSGLFVAASKYHCNLYTAIYTHFPNAEDSSMNCGLLDAELLKLSQIIDYMKPNSLLLMNESFSTTTEKEASYIAKELTQAFKELSITTLFVTHLYEYAKELYEESPPDVVFYRALRIDDGTRTYKIEQGEPLKTSFGIDLYKQIIM